MHASTPRRGFTLVELMVVIGILAVLMTLLIPAVSDAIESGRRTSCAMKTSKLAMAMTSYDSRQGYFPGIRNNLAIKSPGGSGLRIDYTSGLSPGHYPMPDSTTNWFVMILPHLERTDAFNAVVDGLLWIGSGGMGSPSAHRTLTRSLTECPSRGDFYTLAYTYVTMHYRANASTATSFNSNDGVIGDNSNRIFVSLADVVAGDGASSTLLIAEGRQDVWYPNTWTVVEADPSRMTGKTSCGTIQGLGSHNFYDPGKAQVHPDVGGGLLFGFPPSLTTPTATTRIININGGPGYYPSNAMGAFGNQSSGAHRGGVNVAFVDGSSRFLKDQLQPHVYGHLLTHRSVWQPITTTTGTYATNSGIANAFLQCPPATKPYPLNVEDY